MPVLGMLQLLIAVAVIMHAHRTGRPTFWRFVAFMPVVGPLAYLLFEILPELAQTRRGRQVASDFKTIINPDADWRHLNRQVQEQDTVEVKCKYAEECERKGMWGEAIGIYLKAAQGAYADDPEILRGLARAELGSGDAKAAEATLSRLREAHPDYQNQDAHLTFARALEAQERNKEAVEEYRALAGYFVGLEARARYGLLLQKTGDPAGARKLFDEVVRASEARGVALTPEDRDWARVAKRNIVG